jgi:transcription elongation GreA/GreB family factor
MTPPPHILFFVFFAMQHISYVLEDEYEYLLSQKNKREEAFREQSRRKKESAEQSSETRHDNYDFEDAERQQQMISGKIQEMNRLINQAKILCMTALTTPPSEIRIGTTAHIRMNGKEKTYMIGGSPTIPGRVSYGSPLGHALMYAKVGDTVTFIHDGKSTSIDVLHLS